MKRSLEAGMGRLRSFLLIGMCSMLTGCINWSWIWGNDNPNGAKPLPPLDAYLVNFPVPPSKVPVAPVQSQVSAISSEPSKDEGISVSLANYIYYNDNPRMNRDIVAKMVADAEINCTEFENTMETGEIGSSLASDATATVLSGVGAVVAPVSVSHVFSAGGAISSGVGSDFQKDYFAKVSIQAFSAAIDSTFGKAIQEYNATLNSVPVTQDSSIIPAIEYEKITSMLDLCSLGDASNSAITTLTTQQKSEAGSAAATNGEEDIQFSGNGSGTVKMVSDAKDGTYSTVTATIVKADAPGAVVQKILVPFLHDLPVSSGISASTTTTASNDDTLQIIGPSTMPTWTVTPPAGSKLTVTYLKGGPGSQAAAAAGGGANQPAAVPAIIKPASPAPVTSPTAGALPLQTPSSVGSQAISQ